MYRGLPDQDANPAAWGHSIVRTGTAVWGWALVSFKLGRSLVWTLSAALAAIAGVGACLAGARVGETRHIVVAKTPSLGLETMKADYRGPTFIPFPKDNPFTPEKAALGKILYFDTRLSENSAQSCASCHSPGFGWGDGLSLGIGHGMEKLARRSPSIVNVAWGETFMWDGRAPTLEAQALGPIQSAGEMNMQIGQLIARLNSISGYQPLFAASFPGQGISADSVANAIATFERTIVSDHAPFDAWIAGNEKAISDEAKRGFVTFNTKGMCSSCHEGWNFTNGSFHDIGLASADVGRGQFMPQVPKMRHAFKTPGLREIARRGPYMHDGSVATLESVIEHYDSGGIERSSRSDLIKPLGLTADEKTELIAFLNTLTSRPSPTSIPMLPQ